MGVSIIALALLALIPGFIAKQKGRSFFGYYFGSFLISPLITTIIALCVSNQAYVYCPKDSIIVEKKSDQQELPQVNYPAANISGWQCSCGRVHPKYESSCVCGKSKYDSIKSPKTEENAAEATEGSAAGSQSIFCHKCGEKLIENSRFCRKCGTQIVKE